MTTQNEYKKQILGTGLVAPLQRVGGDFNYAQGEALLKAGISQVLKTRPGEILWRPDFGIDLERFRHRNNTQTLAAEVAQLVSEAVSSWDGRINVTNCSVKIEDNYLYIRVSWEAISYNEQGSRVLIASSQEVKI